MRLTVGPLPPAVYWRRRALVLGGALLVLFLIAQACNAVSASSDNQGANESEPPASPPQTETDPPDATAPPTAEPESDDLEEPGGTDAPVGDDEPPVGSESGLDPDDPERCADDEIRVTAHASRTELAPGETVQFTIRIAHDADRTCRRDVGGDHRELWLVQGADHVWSSRDCDPPTGSLVMDAGQGMEREHHIAFVGRGSERCDGAAAVGDELPAGEYELYARLGTVRSEPVLITLTG